MIQLLFLFLALVLNQPALGQSCTCAQCTETTSVVVGTPQVFYYGPCSYYGATATFQFQATDTGDIDGASTFTVQTMDATNYALYQASLSYIPFSQGSTSADVSCFDSASNVGGTSSFIYILVNCQNNFFECPLQYTTNFQCNGNALSTPPTSSPSTNPQPTSTTPTNPPSTNPQPTNPQPTNPQPTNPPSSNSGSLGSSLIGQGTSTGVLIAVATFSDSACTTLSTTPVVILSGSCLYSTAFSTYFSASATSVTAGTISGQFDCNEDCSSCSNTYTSSQGQCQLLTGGEFPNYVSVSTLEPNEVVAETYSDSSCQVKTSSTSVEANECSDLTVLGTSTGYFASAILGSGEVALAYDCNSACSTCSQFLLTSLNTCLSIGDGIYVTVQSSASALPIFFSLFLVPTLLLALFL